MSDPSLPLSRRLSLAFKVLFDGHYARRVEAAAEDETSPEALPPAPAAITAITPAAPVARGAEALQLLSLLQREGRLVDFVQQDIAAFSDADVGAAARLVHEGCRRALHTHARIVSVRSEAEGSRLTLERASADVKLVGNVAGTAPYRGVLRHRGWRAEELTLPTVVGTHDASVIAPAELELS